MADNVPIGKLYGDLYLPRGDPTEITPKLRTRLYGYFKVVTGTHWEFESLIAAMILREMGIGLAYGGLASGYPFDKFFADRPATDIFHAITHIWHFLDELPSTRERGDAAKRAAKRWITDVVRAFREENVRYWVDEQGGVHPLVDPSFEQVRIAAIRSLQGQRYVATLGHFEAGQDALSGADPDGKTAIWSTFEAVENIFKLMIGNSASRIGTSEIRRHLPRALDQAYPEVRSRQAADKLMNSLCDWVEGAHFYRHAAGGEEPTHPPLGLAILFVSQGGSFLRWLAEIDRVVTAKAPGE